MNRRIATLYTLKPYLEARPDRTIAEVIMDTRVGAVVNCSACRAGAAFSARHCLTPGGHAAQWVASHNAGRHPRRAARAALDLPANTP